MVEVLLAAADDQGRHLDLLELPVGYAGDRLVRLRDEGMTVLLVEQKARQALKIASRAYLMETGKILASGLPQDLGEDELLSKAFLGAEPARP